MVFFLVFLLVFFLGPQGLSLSAQHLSMTTTVNSYYQASAHAWPEQSVLIGDVAVDVCVVGGGIAGCSAALHLAERGYSVALLEAQHIGWGASGRSGGQIIAGFACGQEPLEQQLGLQAARQMWDVSVEGVALLRSLIARHHIECDLRWGYMEVALKPRQREELRMQQHKLENLYRYSSLRLLEKAELRAELATQRYLAGLYDAEGGHLHPLNYVLGLAAAAQRAGVQIYERSPVVAIQQGGEVQLHTANARVRARFAVLCCNAYIHHLEPMLDKRIMPIVTYIAASEPLGEQRASQLIKNNIAVSDANFILDYFRRSADHRLLFGGRVSYSGKDWGDTANTLRKRMLSVFPQLRDVRIEYAWSGRLDITLNRAPDFGRLAPNVYYLQGFSGHGIALAGMAGKLASEAIAGQAERFDLFSKLKHRHFPGGDLLRTPALVLGMLWYRLRDWL